MLGGKCVGGCGNGSLKRCGSRRFCLLVHGFRSIRDKCESSTSLRVAGIVSSYRRDTWVVLIIFDNHIPPASLHRVEQVGWMKELGEREGIAGYLVLLVDAVV
jgi:hypothetical protein